MPNLELNLVEVLQPLAVILMPLLHSPKLKSACDRMKLRWLRCRSLSSKNLLNNKHMMPRKTQKRLRSQLPKLAEDHNS